MAEHFKGRVQAYEIWNEQNLDREVGRGNVDPRKFLRLLKAGRDGVKAGDPDALVIMGAPSLTGVNDPGNIMDDVDYLRGTYEAIRAEGGNPDDYFDIVGAHPSGFGNGPDDTLANHPNSRAPGWNNHPSFFAFERMAQYREIMNANGDSEKPIWFTEYGYASTPSPVPGYEYAGYISEADQAAFLRRAFEKAVQERDRYGIGGMFIWNLNFQSIVGPEDEKWAFGVLRGDWSPRPAYAALKDMPKQP
jgi:hypothetical protein